MAKKKICVVVASRANYGRIKSFLQAVKDHPDLELQLIVAASALLYRFGSAIDVIRRDGFEPNATVYIVIEGENPTTMAKSTGLAVVELATIFENMKPDAVVTVADRFETMATAIAASYMNIPVVHTQGGEVSGSIDESVRHAVTKLSHVHFPATKHAGEFLIRMGEDPARVFVTGCPSLDILQGLDLSLDHLHLNDRGSGASIDLRKPYLLVLQHPVTTEFGKGFMQINETLEAVRRIGMQTIWLWPNVDAGSDDVAKGLRVFRNQHPEAPIRFFRNFAPEDYLRLLNGCASIVGNSSSGLRESAFLGVPSVTIGSRQALRERGANVVEVPHEAEAIEHAIRKQLDHGRYPSDKTFGDGYAGRSMANILAEIELSPIKKLHYVIEPSSCSAK